MMITVVLPIILGFLTSLYLVGHAMMTIPCPYERVAFYLTVLASCVSVSFLAWILLSHSAYLFVLIFSFTLFGNWSIMDKRAMVHHNSEEE